MVLGSGTTVGTVDMSMASSDMGMEAMRIRVEVKRCMVWELLSSLSTLGKEDGAEDTGAHQDHRAGFGNYSWARGDHTCEE